MSKGPHRPQEPQWKPITPERLAEVRAEVLAFPHICSREVRRVIALLDETKRALDDVLAELHWCSEPNRKHPPSDGAQAAADSPSP